MSTALATTPPAVDAVARPETATAVRVEHLRKSFAVRRSFLDTLRHPFRVEKLVALDDVSLEIKTGEFFGLLGSNGAGKTTLFKILATLITPDRGQASVNGFDVVRSAAQIRHQLTPVIADERSLRWRLTARENLRLFATLYELPRRDIDRRVDEILKIVGLEDTGRKMVGRFSSGMKQRLLIGRALIPKPRVLLLDEPTRSLDPVSARSLRQFLRQEICKALGCTVLLATHSADEAFELCDRVAVLNRGRIVVVGPTEKLVFDFGDDRYCLWTKAPLHPAVDALAGEGLVSEMRVHPPDDDGWMRVDLEVPGGLDRAALAVGYLAERGVPVGRFERSRLSLGELIQRAIRRQQQQPGGDRA
jgi:ABC-2 type transport system ATP-binding protein